MPECAICGADKEDSEGRSYAPRELSRSLPRTSSKELSESAAMAIAGLVAVSDALILFNDPPGQADREAHWICDVCRSSYFAQDDEPARSAAAETTYLDMARLPVREKLLHVLRIWSSLGAVDVCPDIPAKYLEEVRRACEIPDGESVLGALSRERRALFVLGGRRMRNYLAFGEQSIYYHNEIGVRQGANSMSYDRFAKANVDHLVSMEGPDFVYLGRGRHFNADKTGVPKEIVAEILTTVGQALRLAP